MGEEENQAARQRAKRLAAERMWAIPPEYALQVAKAEAMANKKD